MRMKMKKLNNTRSRFTGTFGRFGVIKCDNGNIINTILVCGVKDANGKYLAHHNWLVIKKEFADLDLRGGDIISFNASVKMYRKGSRNRSTRGTSGVKKNYSLRDIKNIKKVTGRGDGEK